MQAVRIYERGGPEVLRLEEIPQPTPGKGEVLIKVAVAGLNFADVGQRQGTYPNLAALPLTLGSEVAGSIAAIGSGVQGLTEGSRVVSLVEGGYAEYAIAQVRHVTPLPAEVSFAQATVVPIQGQTAYLLLKKAARFQPGERILIHAAAGGVGTLAVQLAKRLGASMIIGSTHSAEKHALLRELGVELIINTAADNWVEQVLQATHGQGVQVVLESIGGGVGQQSLACLAQDGRMITFGSLSNEVTPFFTQMLIQKCLTITGYNTLLQTPETQQQASQDLLELIASGSLQVILDQSFPLAEVSAAHYRLESGQTSGKVVLNI